MKDISSELAGHLAGGATTLAHCWVVTRKDGQRIGFTDHDRSLTVDGLSCQPQNGLETSSLAAGPGLATGGGEVSGALSLSGLSDDDLEAGLWDGASVEVHLVNWADPSQTQLLRRARVGEVSRNGDAFQAELRGLSHLLEVKRGRVFARTCDADLGDDRCGVDLSDPAYQAEGTVTRAGDLGELEIAGLSAFSSGWFNGGRLEVLTGAHAGFRSEVAAHRLAEGVARVGLWQAPPSSLEAGTQIRVSAGCDKQVSTCRAKFSNELNFQGFPHMPGTDFVLSYPTRNTGENDGGVLVS
ncbi:DUF2163 domain-containing protein [Roseibium polysiphoniae]|uniref:DUF2163 domain-containing protein n=1 Tax=Roseibium polysiphoniae TaxID=2571221 RepID=UPI003298AC04